MLHAIDMEETKMVIAPISRRRSGGVILQGHRPALPAAVE